MTQSRLHLFEAYGIEVEYMIVDQTTLNLYPIADEIFKVLRGECTGEANLGKISLSNELVQHVIEFKTTTTESNWHTMIQDFQSAINKVKDILKPFGASLLSTGAHPWMKPEIETVLWPYDCQEIYQIYDKIFNCKGHGWSNLQSVHLNLPFSSEEEFVRLHQAIRLILPIIPALSASSPILENQQTSYFDTRLEFYRKNQAAIPSISGWIIPEEILSYQEYQRKILDPMYEAISPFDPNQLLQNESLNSRGAIARFDRHAIEIRVIDTQECILADLAICYFITETLKYLIYDQDKSLNPNFKSIHEKDLYQIFLNVIQYGSHTKIDQPDYLFYLGIIPKFKACSKITAQMIWKHLFDILVQCDRMPEPFFSTLNIILEKGNLAERIINKMKAGFSTLQVYSHIANCLAKNKLFI